MQLDCRQINKSNQLTPLLRFSFLTRKIFTFHIFAKTFFVSTSRKGLPRSATDMA